MLQGLDVIYNTVFPTKTARDHASTSFLLHAKKLIENDTPYPSSPQLKDWDMVAHEARPFDLQRLVWIALQWYNARQETQPDCER